MCAGFCKVVRSWSGSTGIACSAVKVGEALHFSETPIIDRVLVKMAVALMFARVEVQMSDCHFKSSASTVSYNLFVFTTQPVRTSAGCLVCVYVWKAMVSAYLGGFPREMDPSLVAGKRVLGGSWVVSCREA